MKRRGGGAAAWCAAYGATWAARVWAHGPRGPLTWAPNSRARAVTQVVCVPRQPADLLLVLASDGLWDVMGNEEVHELAWARYQREMGRNGSNLKVRGGATVMYVSILMY